MPRHGGRRPTQRNRTECPSGGHNAGSASEPGRPGRSSHIAAKTADGLCLSPDEWIDSAETKSGSWWAAWTHWLEAHSDATKTPPPGMGAPDSGLAPEGGKRLQAAGFRRRLLRRPATRFAVTCLLLILLLALTAPWITFTHPLDGGNDALFPPGSPGHWLGTDNLGRDIWPRVVYGPRISLLVGVASAALAVAIGVLVGALAGYFGGWLDTALMRVAAFFQTLPRDNLR